MRSVIVALAFAAAFVAVVFGLRRLRAAPQTVERGPWSRLRATFWLAVAALLGPGAACGDGGDDGWVECYVPAYDGGYDDSSDMDADADADAENGIWVECYRVDDATIADESGFDADADAEANDGEDVREDAFIECYVAPFDDAGYEADGDLDAAADADADPDADAGAEAEPDPDAGPDVAPDPDISADTPPDVGLAPPPAPADPRWERWAVRTELRARTVAALLADPGTATVVRDELAREERRLKRRVAVIKARRRRPPRPSTPAGGRGSR